MASGSGSTSGGRSSDRLGAAGGGLDFSDGGESHGAYTEEDDLDRGDVGDAADSERYAHLRHFVPRLPFTFERERSDDESSHL